MFDEDLEIAEGTGINTPINVLSNKEGDVLYSYNGEGISVVVSTTFSGVTIDQNGYHKEFPKGAILGDIHFRPFGMGEHEFRHIKDKFGRTSKVSKVPEFPIIAEGLTDLANFIEKFDKSGLPEPEILHSSTNLRMAEFATRIGFNIPGYVTSGMDKESRKIAIEKLNTEHPQNVKVTTSIDNLRNLVRDNERLRKISQRMERQNVREPSLATV